MRRAALALALLIAASAAVLAASPAELHQRTVEFRRELRRQSVTRTLSNEDLLARLEALKAEHEKDPDPKVAASLERAEANLKLLIAGEPLPPPDEAENDPGPTAPPVPLQPESPIRSSPVLENAHAVVLPDSAADYFDRSKAHAGAAPVSVPDKMPNSDLTGYLALKDEAVQRAHLRETSAKLLALLSIGDLDGARAQYLAERLHRHLSGHARRANFASLRVRAVDGRLRLAYALKDGTVAEEDLGPILEWTTPPAAGGVVGGGRERASKSPKGAKTAKASKGGKSGGGGGRHGGASRSAKRAAKGGGKAFDGGDDASDSGSSAGGGKAHGRGRGRGRHGAGDASGSDSEAGGAGPHGARSGRSSGLASLGRPRVSAGRGLSSGEGSGGAFSARRSASVPLPKGFAARSVHDPVAGGSTRGGNSAGGITGAPPRIKAGKGNTPDGLTAPATAAAVASAARAKSGESVAAGPAASAVADPRPASMAGDEELRDAVAAHEARLPVTSAVPYRSAAHGGDEEPSDAGVSWEVVMAALGATAIAAALLQARRGERPLAS
jgi:hypothetical protein